MGRMSVRPSVHLSVRPSIRPLTILFFTISSLITWPTKLEVGRLILDIGAHSRSVPDFVISSQEALCERVS